MKIVALTASAFKEQRKGILEAGCDEVVHKPFQSHEIFDCMAERLGVNYRYEKEAPAFEELAVTLSAEMLATLPKPLRDELRTAAELLDVGTMEALLERVHDEWPEVADGLKLITDSFDFGRILALLDEVEAEV